MRSDELLHLDHFDEFGDAEMRDIEIIEEHEDVESFRVWCDQCGTEMILDDEGDIPTMRDGKILHFTYCLCYSCPECDNEDAYPMYTWRWKAKQQGPMYRPELQDISTPGFLSPRAINCLETSEYLNSSTERFHGHDHLHLRTSHWPELTARETEDLLDSLKSYREEPDKWGGIHEINDHLDLVFRPEGAFFRVNGTASGWIDEKELDRLIEKIEWTTCRHCNRRIGRVRLLEISERRLAEARTYYDGE